MKIKIKIMKLTRDEARILAFFIEVAKYDADLTKEQFSAVEDLQKRLKQSGKDLRRKGRTSMDTWQDMMKRFVKMYQKSKS
jgi:hypothetical protein